jgi:hypothetical protein
MASLKNSHTRSYESKLRRTDQVLHETTQRFVESLSKDTRISQYADLNFVAKKVLEGQGGKWCWLDMLGRAGYLVFHPGQPVIWLDEQNKNSFKIPIRVSSLVVEKKTVLLASLDKVNGILRLEDAWLLEGEFLRQRTFTERWERVKEFYDTQFREDSHYQQGLQVEMASFSPLTQALTWSPPFSKMALLQPDQGPRRLRVQFEEQQRQPMPGQVKGPLLPTPATAGMPLQAQAKLKTTPLTQNTKSSTKLKEGTALAVPHEDFPDTYNLWVDGVKKGYAAVQDLDLSLALRKSLESLSGKKECVVNIQWNSEFEMYEIKSLVS